MTDSNKSALQLLEEMRKERDELNSLIQALEKRLGISSVSQTSESDDEKIFSNPPTGTRSTLSFDSIPLGFFHNLSQATAAEKLLRLNPQQPLTTNQIMEAFHKSGMDVSGKNAMTILYTALKRNPRIERVAGKAWGLSEWYGGKSSPKKSTGKGERFEQVMNAGPTTLAKAIKQVDDRIYHSPV